MLNEVYLMSSLPALSFGQAPPISDEEFRDMAKNELSAKSFETLERMSMRGMDSKGRKAKLKSVNKMHLGLLKDVSEIRNSRTENRQAIPGILPGSVLEANPLDREMQIMQWQWEKLDAIVASKTFTLSEVIVYKLKLQLLFRMHSFSMERGERVLNSVVNPTAKKED
jgi:Protein of unknown function (DUF2764)